MLFEVPANRLSDLKMELLQWTQFSTFTRRQLQLLLGKLSFVTACIRPGQIFMSRLLNRLRSLPSKPSRFPVTSDMLSDIDWWLTFLPHFNGSAEMITRTKDLKFLTEALSELGSHEGIKIPATSNRKLSHFCASMQRAEQARTDILAPSVPLSGEDHVPSCNNTTASSSSLESILHLICIKRYKSEKYHDNAGFPHNFIS